VTLNLTVYNNTTAQVNATVCASALPYTWGGHVFAAAGTFVDTLLTTHGADSVVTYTLTVDEIAATIPTVTHVTCFGGSNGAATATVTGGMPNFAYAWTNAAGTSVSTSTSINNQPAGTYTFTVTDAIGCVATATVTLNTLNDALQPGTIAEDQVVCEGEQPLPFTGTAASGGDNGTYQWQISTNGTDWTAALGTNNTQNYTYPNVPTTAFSLRRAWVSQSCGTEYSNTVNITLWPNTIDTVTGAVCQNEAFEGFGFEITADQTAAPGDHTFEQHHASGHCDSMVVLILTVNPLFETEVEDVVCEGEGYSDNGFEVAPTETLGEQLLTRTLTLQSADGCDSVVTLRLKVIDTAVSIVSLTLDFCENLSAELMVVTDMPNYVWSTGETSPSITVMRSGNYYVTASQGECSNTARFVIEGCNNQLLLPNAITPSNHDGLNDYFSIPERNVRSINLFEIWIYNRWGELVYYSNDKNFHWNGEYRGEIQYQTIYNYIIRYTDAAGKPEFVKGSVTVL
jgi:gliding motility-associated-like protein